MGEYYYDSKKKKKKPGIQYDYSFGDVHPGFQIGHRRCAVPLKGLPIPARMGWLWNVPDIAGRKYRRGWQPGMIKKSILEKMSFKCPKNTQDKDRKKRRRRMQALMGLGHMVDSDPEEVIEVKPTLRIKRKGDEFTFQVNPLKDLTEIMPNEDPYVDCDPIIFKITKKRSPEEKAKVEAQKMIRLKKRRDAEIRKALTEAAEDICKCAYMDVFCNDLTAIDPVITACPAFLEPTCECREESLSSLSSNASWDMEYTPPFGCFDVNDRKKKLFTHVDTQYNPGDAGITIETDTNNVKCRNSLIKVSKKKKCRKSCCACR